MNLPSAQIIFGILCTYSVLAPIAIGARNYSFLNSSLKIILYWLIFNLLYAISTYFLAQTLVFHYLEYINSAISFLFFYAFMLPHWKSEKIKKIMLYLTIIVILAIIADVILNFTIIHERRYYSSIFQTFVWILVGFYYLQVLMKSTEIKSFRKYPMFWIGIANFVCPTIAFAFYIVTNSTLRISPSFYFIFYIIGYFATLLFNFLIFLGLKTSKNGIKEIIKV